MRTDLADALRATVPTGRVISDFDLMETYCRDQSALSPSAHPRAVVMASSVDDVRAALVVAHDRDIPVVTRGAGSGLSGGANATEGCVVLVTLPMNQIIDVSSSDLQAVVEPGVFNADLKRAAKQANLFYPPDPASSEFCSIGGNIATNAGGLCCLKYGVTRDYVMALDVVLADGSLLHTGSRTRKSVAGYDLTGLIVGSEGTLGIVVGATLRLIPATRPAATAVATFETLERVGELPGLIAGAGITPSMLEVIDQRTIAAIENYFPMGLDPTLGALVIAQSDNIQSGHDAERIGNIAIGLGAMETYHTADPVEADMLLQARKLAYPALEKSPGVALLDDVGVPITRIPRLVTQITRIAAEHGIEIAIFGHLGDGNLHPTILYDPTDPAAQHRAQAAFDSIIWTAIDLGGTVTGEHGLGNLKTLHVLRQLDNTSIGAHQSIKHALDPDGILNPGKGLPYVEGIPSGGTRARSDVETNEVGNNQDGTRHRQ